MKEPVGEHFILSGRKWEDMTIVVIDHDPYWMDTERKNKEKFLTQITLINARTTNSFHQNEYPIALSTGTHAGIFTIPSITPVSIFWFLYTF